MASKPSDYLDIISSPQAEEPVRLEEHTSFRGMLQNVIEPKGEDFVLACIGILTIEVPKSLAPELWALLGQKVVIGLFDKKHRLERSSL